MRKHFAKKSRKFCEKNNHFLRKQFILSEIISRKLFFAHAWGIQAKAVPGLSIAKRMYQDMWTFLIVCASQ